MTVERLMQQVRGAERRYAANQAARASEIQDAAANAPEAVIAPVPDSADRIIQRAQRTAKGRALLNEMAQEMPAPGLFPIQALYERIIAKNNLMEAAFLLQGAQVSRSVGRVVIRSANGRALGYGTGSMVSPRLLMTNNHVLATPQEARQSIVEFNYYLQPNGQLAASLPFALTPEDFFYTDVGLDFTLVAVQAVNKAGVPVASRGWNPLIADQGKIVVGERANILQHPQGNPQQLALRQNRVTALLENFLHYVSDTEQGSSGSPVFNDEWELLALHHAGVPKRDPQGRILLRSDQPWDSRNETADQIAWIANEGSRVSRIVMHMEQAMRRFNPSQRALYQAVFSQRPALEESLTLAVGAAMVQGGAQDGAALFAMPALRSTLPSGPSVNQNGAVTWTIPVQIQVNVGGLLPPSTAQAAPVPVSTTPSPADTFGGSAGMDGAGVTLVETPLDAEPSLPELTRALNLIQDNAQRPYYQAEEDQRSRDEYYAAMPAQANAQERFRWLHTHISDTHTERFSYKTARLEYLYPWVDLRESPSGQRLLHSIYSGKAFDPIDFVNEDLAVEARLTAAIREAALAESSFDAIQERIADLEADAPFNCEHVVPQSWFNEKSPMREDLHHLFACEKDCNSFRGNIPYFQFPPVNEATRDACGRREGDKFEPLAGKGAVVRATLYFLLRYPQMIGDEERELARSRIDVLLNWHRGDPVTIYELHRNAAIFDIQGNRNPLIDHPEWAEQIDFTLGFGTV